MSMFMLVFLFFVFLLLPFAVFGKVKYFKCLIGLAEFLVVEKYCLGTVVFDLNLVYNFAVFDWF